MPRKNAFVSRSVTRTPRRFNEAAARCRGKTLPALLVVEAEPGASMRPRPDAAEKRRVAGDRGQQQPASMRPRPDAAEKRSVSDDELRVHWELQ